MWNLRADCFPALQEPTILLFLCFQQEEQDSLETAAASYYDLVLDSGFKGCIANFNRRARTKV